MPLKKFTKSKKAYPQRGKMNKVQKYEVRKMIDSRLESKAIDTYSNIGAQYGLGAGAIMADVTLIASGATSTTRVGDQIDPISLHLRLYFQQQTTVTDSLTRVIVFQWRPDNAVAPVIGDILDGGPGAIVSPFSQLNFDNRHLSRVLWDHQFRMLGSMASDLNTHTVNKVIPLRRASKVNYDTGVNTGDHHIYVLIIGTNTSLTTGNLYTFNGRLLFKDA